MAINRDIAAGFDAAEDARVETLTKEEARTAFDRVAHRRLGMSGEDFLRRWDAGEFREMSDRPGLMEVVMLLPLVR